VHNCEQQPNSAFQADDEGSIPFTRSNFLIDLSALAGRTLSQRSSLTKTIEQDDDLKTSSCSSQQFKLLSGMTRRVSYVQQAGAHVDIDR
jgi:hypothetical protein